MLIQSCERFIYYFELKKSPVSSDTHGGIEEIILQLSTIQYHTVRWVYDAKK